MIDKKQLLNNFQSFFTNLKSRGYDNLIFLEELKEEIKKTNSLIFKTENDLKRKNILSKEIGSLLKNKNDHDFQKRNQLILELKLLKKTIHLNTKLINKLKVEINDKCLTIPNLADKKAPNFANKEQFEKIFTSKNEYKVINLNHKELGVKFKLINFLKATKISGSKFCIYENKGSILKRALITFMLDIHHQKYQELDFPYLVKSQTMFNSGQYPKFKFDSYQIADSNLSLIPTAEVPLLSYYQDTIFKKETLLPQSFCSFSGCFRKEAGALGKTTSGLYRMHHFNKVELFKFCLPKNSEFEFNNLVEDAVKILKLLELPYRIISLNRQDLGFSAALTYDLEVYSPFLQKYIEVSSISNCKDFQARRAKIRYKDENNKIHYVHTLNGSGVAIDRIFALILENYYDSEQKIIKMPKILRKYLDFTFISLEE